ncbi:NUDIX hydrolase [Phytohabitans rumicis]|uniref:NUDIX hydrolase n=1 Tax=Phytohabitans rumicis TaxID=1076125 RepID=A0A6V8L2G0_9ACTN|nr:NUDIX hydrolase [Phytohabitans rumicis]
MTSAVAAVITDAAGRVLLCQQSQGHRLWCLPGGRIRQAESPVHAAIRDIREETGLETHMVEIVGLYQLSGNSCGEDMPDVLKYVFRGQIDGGEASVNSPGKISRLSWHDPDALPSPLTPITRVAIADAVAGRSGVLREVQRDAEPDIPDAADSEPLVAAAT